MASYDDRVLRSLRRQPLWLQYLVLPLLLPFVPFLLRFTLPATLIVAAVYATLKHRGLLPPEFPWSGIVINSTVCFWMPIFGGYVSSFLVAVRWLGGRVGGRDKESAGIDPSAPPRAVAARVRIEPMWDRWLDR